MTANEVGELTAVAFALMSILLVVRHTRTEKESGRGDPVRAAVVGRHASTTAVLVVVVGVTVGLMVAGTTAFSRRDVR